MNRLEEYKNLLQEINEPVPELETSLERAIHRKKRRNLIYRPFIGMAASFLLFVFLVNFSAPVAHACSQIPFLKELAEAVTFSRSLSDAVEHDYVQELKLTKTNGDVTATIEYLIVDQKQINVFYRLQSEQYHYMDGEPELLSASTDEKLPCSTYWSRGNSTTEGELLSFTADFGDENVPDTIKLQLSVIHYPNMEDESRENDSNIFDIKNTVAEFEFLLEFDPSFTDAGRQIPVDQKLELDGQNITISNIEIYPSHIRINVEDDPANTSWLKELEFYLIADGKEIFKPLAGGITATGDPDSPAMTSFRADSSYFYEAKELEFVITGAVWLDKEKELAYINLETGENKNLPEGVTFTEATEEEDGWHVSVRTPFIKKNSYYQTFGSYFYDTEEKEYISKGRSRTDDCENENSSRTHFIETIELTDFHGKEVWISLHHSHRWETSKPISLKIDMD